ncbi:MAG: phage terminase large subunit [Dehalococcoidales bacterium]|nr:phage terminase large subunit [Dehalococcoidales bacterium]
MINIPPRHGKTRTLVLFSAWCFGRTIEERIIATSYGDEMANDFSRYTRDLIQEQHNRAEDIVYSDIFPATKVQKGNASYQKWALEGQYFSYLGSGIWSGITGKGATLLLEDDLVKDIQEALNETRLDALWKQRTGTLLSRKEEGCKQILTMTRWAEADPCGRILENKEEAPQWYILKMEAMNEETGEMLCPALLGKETYENLRAILPSGVFRANYHQEPIDIKGRLYTTVKTYTELPRREDGTLLYDRIINYTDTADEGNDSLVSISALEYKGEAWILDVYMTQDGMEKTEPETARRLVENGVNWARIESNNGGRGFARAVERIIYEQIKKEQEQIAAGALTEEGRKWNRTAISWFHQTENKIARIKSHSNYIMQHVYFPHNWADRWPVFFKAIMTFMADKTAAHDDAPDALTGIAEVISKSRPSIRLIG